MKALEFDAGPSNEFRVICADCKTVWSTLHLPCECPTCAALVSVRVLRRDPDRRNALMRERERSGK